MQATTPVQQVVLGIDLGTQGVRVLAVTPQGEVAAASQVALREYPKDLPEGWFEQSPEEWWQAVRLSLQTLTNQLPKGIKIMGICVVSTSGTILPVDSKGNALYPAVMYNDRRSEEQVPAVRQAAADHQVRHGYIFSSSFALPKMLWFKQHMGGVYVQTSRFLHAADFIAGRLCGTYTFSDTSNSLKMGYDLLKLSWPTFIEKDLGIPKDLLPEVVLPGTIIGRLSAWAAQETGLPAEIPVTAGATDGTAAQIASGASSPGDWNSTLGTTLVVKGISPRLVTDPQGRIYSHRHPEGWWMPGGASNTGAEWIQKEYPGIDPSGLDDKAERVVPTKLVRYPLVKTGERFPFMKKDALGFILGRPAEPIEAYAAGLEGLALLEKLAYNMLEQIGLETGPRIYITGGGSRSSLWNRIRASALDRTLIQPETPETAMGAAILAASGCWYESLGTASKQMVRISQVIEPEPTWQSIYTDRFEAFRTELVRRGYLD